MRTCKKTGCGNSAGYQSERGKPLCKKHYTEFLREEHDRAMKMSAEGWTCSWCEESLQGVVPREVTVSFGNLEAREDLVCAACMERGLIRGRGEPLDKYTSRCAEAAEEEEEGEYWDEDYESWDGGEEEEEEEEE